LSVFGDWAIDPDVKVAIDAAGEHELPSRVDDVIRIARCDPVFDRDDPPIANADVRANRTAEWNDDRTAGYREVIARQESTSPMPASSNACPVARIAMHLSAGAISPEGR